MSIPALLKKPYERQSYIGMIDEWSTPEIESSDRLTKNDSFYPLDKMAPTFQKCVKKKMPLVEMEKIEDLLTSQAKELKELREHIKYSKNKQDLDEKLHSLGVVKQEIKQIQRLLYEFERAHAIVAVPSTAHTTKAFKAEDLFGLTYFKKLVKIERNFLVNVDTAVDVIAKASNSKVTTTTNKHKNRINYKQDEVPEDKSDTKNIDEVMHKVNEVLAQSEETIRKISNANSQEKLEEIKTIAVAMQALNVALEKVKKQIADHVQQRETLDSLINKAVMEESSYTTLLNKVMMSASKMFLEKLPKLKTDSDGKKIEENQKIGAILDIFVSVPQLRVKIVKKVSKHENAYGLNKSLQSKLCSELAIASIFLHCHSEKIDDRPTSATILLRAMMAVSDTKKNFSDTTVDSEVVISCLAFKVLGWMDTEASFEKLGESLVSIPQRKVWDNCVDCALDMNIIDEKKAARLRTAANHGAAVSLNNKLTDQGFF